MSGDFAVKYAQLDEANYRLAAGVNKLENEFEVLQKAVGTMAQATQGTQLGYWQNAQQDFNGLFGAITDNLQKVMAASVKIRDNFQEYERRSAGAVSS